MRFFENTGSLYDVNVSTSPQPILNNVSVSCRVWRTTNVDATNSCSIGSDGLSLKFAPCLSSRSLAEFSLLSTTMVLPGTVRLIIFPARRIPVMREERPTKDVQHTIQLTPLEICIVRIPTRYLAKMSDEGMSRWSWWQWRPSCSFHQAIH